MSKLFLDLHFNVIKKHLADNKLSYSDAKDALLKFKKLLKDLKKLEKDIYPLQIETYVKTIQLLFGLPRIGAGLLLELTKRIDVNNEIHLNRDEKRKILDQLEIQEKNYTNVICKLLSSGLLTRLKTHSYKANHIIFGGGGWDSITAKKDLWIKLTFNDDGAPEVITSFSDKPEKIKL